MLQTDRNAVLAKGGVGGDARKLDLELRKLGFKLVGVGKHKKYKNEKRLTVTVPTSPSDVRWSKNTLKFAQRVTENPELHPAMRKRGHK